MLSIHFLSLQINISWSKKVKSEENINQYIHANEIEKKINETKNKAYEFYNHI